MPEEDLHLFDLTRLQAHEGRNKSGHDVERDPLAAAPVADLTIFNLPAIYM
jgi:hypothetical protein